MDLRGAHVLVTGGSKGIGAALAREFAGRGARVTSIARASAELANIAAEVNGEALELDLSELDRLDGVIARAEERNGPVDVLVNNAAQVTVGPLSGLGAADMRAQMITNLLAPMELTRQALPGMLTRDRGAVINMSSLAGEVPLRHIPSYSASKSALTKFTLDLQAELKGTRVAVVLVILGAVPGTQLVTELEKDPVAARGIERAKRFKLITPAEVADRVVDGVVSDQDRIVVMPRLIAPLVHARLAPTRVARRLLN
jgi:short-subunit dehydrogenase